MDKNIHRCELRESKMLGGWGEYGIEGPGGERERERGCVNVK
jgi:hypothetical protein